MVTLMLLKIYFYHDIELFRIFLIFLMHSEWTKTNLSAGGETVRRSSYCFQVAKRCLFWWKKSKTTDSVFKHIMYKLIMLSNGEQLKNLKVVLSTKTLP